MPLIADWGFVGSTYAGQSPAVNVERCVNMYPEVTVATGARSKRKVVYYPTPGLLTWSSAGLGPLRGEFYQDGNYYVASGGELYSVSAAGVATKLGDIAQDPNPVQFSTNGAAGDQLFVVSAGLGYIVTISTGAFVQITDADFPAVAVMGDFSDGYFLALKFNSIQFNFSALENGLSWPTASFANKSQSSDNILSLLVDHKEVWLFGSKTTEIWYNTGDPTNPFAPIQGVLIEHGILAPRSAVKVNNTICWLGQDSDGSGMAWYANGYTPERFSTHGVEQQWQSYGVTLADAIGWAYQENGHSFYVVTFPTANKTWAFDFASQMWHERLFWNGSDYDAHLGRCHAYAFGKHLLGSRLDGTIYHQSLSYYDDDGSILRRMRRSPHIDADQRFVEYASAELECQHGVGLLSGQGEDPQAMLRWSDDDGYNWSNEYWSSIGLRGAYAFRTMWRRLGQGRNRVWEIVQTDPVPLAWTDLILNGTAMDA